MKTTESDALKPDGRTADEKGGVGPQRENEDAELCGVQLKFRAFTKDEKKRGGRRQLKSRRGGPA